MVSQQIMHSVSSSSSSGICLGGAAVGGLNLNLTCFLTGISSFTSSRKGLIGTLLIGASPSTSY